MADENVPKPLCLDLRLKIEALYFTHGTNLANCPLSTDDLVDRFTRVYHFLKSGEVKYQDDYSSGLRNLRHTGGKEARPEPISENKQACVCGLAKPGPKQPVAGEA